MAAGRGLVGLRSETGRRSVSGGGLAFEHLELGDDLVVDVDQVGDVGAGVVVAAGLLVGAVGDESGGGHQQ